MNKKLNSHNSIQNKIEWIELLRIFSCFGVVLLHTAATHFTDTSPDTFKWKIFNFYHGITRYSVPIFIMISGLLYLDKARKITFKKLYSKYILRIFTAYVFWSIFYGFFDILFNKNYKDTILNTCKTAIKYSIDNNKGHLWYLPALIGILIITPILKEAINNDNSKQICEYTIILFFIFKVIKSSIIIFNMPHIEYIRQILNIINPDLVCGWVGLYILGYYLFNYPIDKKYNIHLYFLGIVSILIGIYLCQYFSINMQKATQDYYTGFRLPQTLFAISVFLFFKNVISKINISIFISNIIYKISSCTFGIYLVHPLVKDILKHFGIDTLLYNPILFVPFLAFIIFLLSYILTYIIKKIPYLEKYIA